jgi:predicted aspartyl protease
MKLKVWAIAGGVALLQGSLAFGLAPRFNLAQLDRKGDTQQNSTETVLSIQEQRSTQPPVVAQAPKPKPSPTSAQGQALLQEVVQCTLGKVKNPQQASMETLQAASMECMYSVVLLDKDGKIRPDANDRLGSIVNAAGVRQPKPIAQGQATLPLTRLPGKSLFTLPVAVGSQPQAFLLDTGAAMSIVDTQLAKNLNLKGTPLPKGVMQNFAVGQNCKEVSVSLHPLPPVSVGSAKVSGMTGIGLPKTSIPGNVAGVLGIDFLSGFDVVLNPKSAQLQLLPPSRPVPKSVPLVGKFGLMTTQVFVNGQGPFTFAIDTGAEWMVVSDRLAQKLSIMPKSGGDIEVEGFCGKEKGKQTKISTFRLQNYQSKDLNTAILSSGLLDMAGVDGIIGQNFLNQYSQHWRFGNIDALGFPKEGSLELTLL